MSLIRLKVPYRRTNQNETTTKPLQQFQVTAVSTLIMNAFTTSNILAGMLNYLARDHMPFTSCRLGPLRALF